jgi:hypothetical protein
MCGRFTLHTPESRLREAFHLVHSTPLGLRPCHNIAPSQHIPIIRDAEISPRVNLRRESKPIPHSPAGSCCNCDRLTLSNLPPTVQMYDPGRVIGIFIALL